MLPQAPLKRFDITFYRDKSGTDSAQVPFSNAVVQFYRQGGTTVNSTTTVPAGSSAINLVALGEIAVGATVSAGVGGASLSVTAVNSPTQITVSNSGSAFSIPPLTRLIVTSNRPQVYADPFGTIALGSSLTADTTGRVVRYVAQTRFDYVVQGNTTFDAYAFETMAGADGTSWAHTVANNSNRILLVAISWTGVNGDETISSVTYAGQAMGLLATASSMALYYLVNPPVGTANVSVQFNTGAQVYAVFGSFSAYGVNPQSSFQALTASGTTGTSASVTLPSTATSSLLFAALGIGNQGVATTVTPGQTGLWNTSTGTSPYITNGAGERTAGTGGNVAMTFSWTGNRFWGIAGIELKAAYRLYVDAEGGYPTPGWLNASNFSSIQAAIDALPSEVWFTSPPVPTQ